MAEKETAAATRTDVQWPSFVAATTATGTWALNRFVFHGDLPTEVAGVVQYGVPLALGWLAAEVRWRTARRRSAAVPSPNEAE